MILQDFLIDGVGEVAAYHVAPALWADQAFDHGGGHFGYFARRHQEDGGDFGGDVAVDVAHRAFVFVVGGGTDAADDKIGFGFAGIIDQKAVFKHADADVGEGVGNGIEHGAAFFYGIGVALFRIGADGDDEFVKEGLGFLYHPQVAEGGRVEAACVHGTARSGRGHFGLERGFVYVQDRGVCQ